MPVSAPAPAVVAGEVATPVSSGGISGDSNFSSHDAATPLQSAASSVEQHGLRPVPVVRVLSPRGVEYVFLTVNLFAAAIGLASVLIALVNGKLGFDILAFPVALLVVSLPLFAWLFLRLKKAELAQPELKLDPSKRRSTQFTQITAYLVVFFSLVGWVSSVFAKIGGKYDGSLVKTSLDVLVLLVVAGGVLAYYWIDEHRN